MDSFNEVIARQADLKARELGEPRALSNHAIARLTTEVDPEGEGINGSTLGHYRTGRRSNPSARTVQLLAAALATSDHTYSDLHAELQEAAGMPIGAAGKWVLPAVANTLTRSEQLVVEGVIRAIAAAKISGAAPRRDDHPGG